MFVGGEGLGEGFANTLNLAFNTPSTLYKGIKMSDFHIFFEELS